MKFRIMKKLCSCLLVLSILTSTGIGQAVGEFVGTNLTVSAADTFTYGNYEYTLNNACVTITKYKGSESYITVPDKINGFPVTEIAEWAFKECSTMKKIQLPTSITVVGEWAFWSCSNLTDVIMSDRIVSIPDCTFYDCINLQNINIPAYCRSIGFSAFYGCAGLKNITIPDYVENIDDAVFLGCTGLMSINVSENNKSYVSENGILFNRAKTDIICYPAAKSGSYIMPSSVENIQYFAFEFCNKLTDITLSENIVEIDNVFRECANLENIYVPEKNPAYSSKDGVLFDKEQKTLIRCPSGKSNYVIPDNFPDNITSIADYAFHSCRKITQITVPYGVVSVGERTFNECSSLRNCVLPDSVQELGMFAFGSCKSLENVVLSDNITSIGTNTFYCCESLLSLTIPSNVKEIGTRAFEYCRSLKDIYIPANVTYIEDYAFAYCNEVVIYGQKGSYAEIYANKLNIPFAEKFDYEYTVNSDNTVTIKKYTGSDTEITIPSVINGKKVTAIGYETFKDCWRIKSITIPNSVTYIGEGAFSYCTSLASITIPDSVTSIRRAVFRGCSGLKSITIPNSVSEIEDYVFYDCSGLTSITIPTGVISISDYAFVYCTGLTSIKIPNSVTYIGTNAFFGCTSLTSITIPNSVTEIGDVAFGKCTGLTNITIPNSVTEIGDSAFYGCTGLTSITIPSGVTKIENRAFENCTNLATISVNSGNSTYSSQNGVLFNKNKTEILAFPCAKTGTYVIPSGVTSIGFCAFEYCTGLTSVTIPTSVTSIGYGAFEHCTGLTSITIPASVTEIGYHTFNGCNNLTIYGNTGSYAETYAKNNSIPFTATDHSLKFQWNEDNWQFENSSKYIANVPYSEKINSTYLDVLKENLSDSEYRKIFWSEGSETAWLNTTGGSCYGMSATLYDLDAPIKHDLNYLSDKNNVSSLITYYQLLQVKDVIQQQCRKVSNRSNKENIQEILSLLDKNAVVLVGYRWGTEKSPSAHAVLAYGYGYENNTFNGVTYDGYIRIYDPNCSYNNTNVYIYFKKSTYDWIIPGKNLSSSGYPPARFHYVGADFNEINTGGYLHNSTITNTSDKFIARIDAPAISGERFVGKVAQSGGVYMSQSDGENDIIEDYSYILNGNSNSIFGYNLYDCDSAYEVSQRTADKLELHMDYENCDLYGYSSQGKSVIFDKKGFVSIEGEAGDYEMSMTFDRDYPTDWFYINVSGTGASDVSLLKSKNGYILSGDNLNKIQVCTKNMEDSASIGFSTGYKKVFIYETDKNTIGLKVDTDNNGIYETDITNVPTLENNSYLSSNNIQLGSSVTVTASGRGGVGSLQYAVLYKKQSETKWTVKQDFGKNTAVSIKPAKATDYDICVKVRDSSGTVKKKYFVVSVYDVLKNTSTVSATQINLGSTVSVKASAAGGAGNYTYAVYYKKKSDTKWTVKQDFGKNTAVSIKPAKATDYDICVKVRDSSGTVEKKYFVVSVYDVLKNTSTVSATQINLGSTVSVKASATGGAGNYTYAVYYKKQSDTKWIVKQDFSKNTAASIKPAKAVNYDICVKVKDSNGNIEKKYFELTVK